MGLHIKEMDDKLDPDQELPFTVETLEGGDETFYLRFCDFLKIKAAFEEWKNSS